jgi:hypothetical protein
VHLRPGCYLPSNPDAVVTSIDYTSGTPMQVCRMDGLSAEFEVDDCHFLSRFFG